MSRRQKTAPPRRAVLLVLGALLAAPLASPAPAVAQDAAAALAEADEKIGKGDLDGALAAVNAALEADEADVPLHGKLAAILMKKGSLVRAKEEIDFVARKGPLTVELDGYLKDLAKIGRERFAEWEKQKAAGDEKKAMTVLFDAFNLNPALAQEQFAELKEATAFWKKAADETPNQGTLFRAAYLCEASGDNDKASEYYAMMLDHITDPVALASVIDRAASLAGGGGRKRLTKADIEAEVERRCKGMTDEEKQQVREYMTEQQSFADRMEAAEDPEEKEAILAEAMSSFKSRAQSGSLPPAVQKMLDEEARKSGKSVDQLIDEQGVMGRARDEIRSGKSADQLIDEYGDRD